MAPPRETRIEHGGNPCGETIGAHSVDYDYALLKYYGVMQFTSYETLHSEAVTEQA